MSKLLTLMMNTRVNRKNKKKTKNIKKTSLENKMWSNLSVLQNTVYPDGFIDKSYVKIKTNTIHITMSLTIIQSFLITLLWVTTKSTWSIVFHFPFTIIEVLWFYKHVIEAWRKQDHEYWQKEQESMNHEVNQIETPSCLSEHDNDSYQLTESVMRLLDELDEHGTTISQV